MKQIRLGRLTLALVPSAMAEWHIQSTKMYLYVSLGRIQISYYKA